MFCSVQEPYFLIFVCLQVLNDRRETLRFSHRFFAYMHLFKREIFSFLQKISKVFHIFYLSWSILLYKKLKNVGLFGQVTT